MPTDIVTTVARCRLSTSWPHEVASASRQLRCQLCSGPYHAKRAANAASVRQYCAFATDRLAAG